MQRHPLVSFDDSEPLYWALSFARSTVPDDTITPRYADTAGDSLVFGKLADAVREYCG